MPAGASPHFYSALAALAAAAAGYAVFRFLASLRRDRYAADTPLARIRSAAQGYVRLEGRADAPPEGELTAPLSGLPCVWWDYKIERRQATGRGEGEWHVIERATSVAPFTLRDADGACLVGPVGADVTPTSHESWFGDTPRPLGTHAPGRPAFGSERSFRYTERLIEPGTHLTVMGELRSHSEVESIDEAVRAMLASWKHDQATLLAKFDRDRDGRIDAQEWETARAAARAQVEAGLAAKESRVSVVGETTHGEPFLIAPLDGAHLVRRERRRAALALAAGVLLVVLTVWAAQKALLS